MALLCAHSACSQDASSAGAEGEEFLKSAINLEGPLSAEPTEAATTADVEMVDARKREADGGADSDSDAAHRKRRRTTR